MAEEKGLSSRELRRRIQLCNPQRPLERLIVELLAGGNPRFFSHIMEDIRVESAKIPGKELVVATMTRLIRKGIVRLALRKGEHLVLEAEPVEET